jgi:hypothetical protein
MWSLQLLTTNIEVTDLSLSKHEIQLHNYTGSSPSYQGTQCISSMNTKWLKACATTQSLPTVRITATSQMQYIVRPRSFINSKFRWYTWLPLHFNETWIELSNGKVTVLIPQHKERGWKKIVCRSAVKTRWVRDTALRGIPRYWNGISSDSSI